MPTEKKLLPESIQIPTAKQKAGATGLLGFSNTLPECPSRLPDGTILDYSAVDETWKDVDFPERENTVQTAGEARAALEESFFKSFQESSHSQATPAHLLKHITRVQGLAALVPSKAEAVEVLEGETPDMRAARSGMSKAKAKMSKYKKGTPGWHAAAGAASQHQFQLGQMKAAQKFRGEGTEPDAIEVVKFDKPESDAVEMKKWQYTKDLAERSLEAQANKAKRRNAELGMKLSQNKAAAAKPTGVPQTLPSPEKKTWSKKGPAAPVHKQPGYFTWRAKQKATVAA